MRRLILLALALAAPVTACKAEQPATQTSAAAPLKLTGRVVDAAQVFDPATESRLTTQLAALEKEVGPQMVVVTTPTLNGADIKSYSMNLGNSWGIGDAKRDDGLLLVVAPNERKVRIELGLGLERTLTDALCAEIIQRSILPEYRKGDLIAGTLNGVDRLDAELRARIKGKVT